MIHGVFIISQACDETKKGQDDSPGPVTETPNHVSGSGHQPDPFWLMTPTHSQSGSGHHLGHHTPTHPHPGPEHHTPTSPRPGPGEQPATLPNSGSGDHPATLPNPVSEGHPASSPRPHPGSGHQDSTTAQTQTHPGWGHHPNSEHQPEPTRPHPGHPDSGHHDGSEHHPG